MSAQQGSVLIAEDEETFRESTVTLLQREGFDCDGVPSGSAAIAKMKEKNYGLIICDIRMPGNSELEMVRAIRETAPLLPIILVTGYPSVETAVKAVDSRVVAYLIKPVAPEDLIRLVKQTFAQHHAAKVVEDNLNRVESWKRDLQAVVATLHPSSAEGFNQTLGIFLSLTLRNIIGALADLRGVVQLVVDSKPSPEVLDALESSRPFMLTSALRDAVHAIERTRVNFKSKELAELRERLEALLREPEITKPLQVR